MNGNVCVASIIADKTVTVTYSAPPPPPVVYGCMDPLATNYNPLATSNATPAGNCYYNNDDDDEDDDNGDDPPPPPPPS